MTEVVVRPLTGADVEAWKGLRLEMLERDPEGFFVDLDEALAMTDEDWRKTIPSFPDVIFGLFVAGELAGSCGFYVEKSAKLAHKGQMWGVYVRAEVRGRGCATALVQAVIDHARLHVDVLQTGASAAGAPIYKRLGFEPYGVEVDAYRVNGKSLDNELMALRFAAPR